MDQKAIVDFLLCAKKHTYAAGAGTVKSSRPSSYDLRYEDGNLLYIDSYLGTHQFSGQEAVWDKDAPIYAMNYTGRVTDEANFSSKFLKKALMNPDRMNPYRGQPHYHEGDYTYTMEYTGDFDWFTGYEKIDFKGSLVYELYFHGGKVVDRNFD